MSPEDQAGRTLGDYRIKRRIGHGAMGVVFEAEQTSLGRSVALKLLRESFADDPERLERFRREARSLGRVNHPNVVHIHGVSQEDGQPWLAMELIQGRSLHDLLVEAEKIPLAERTAEQLGMVGSEDSYEVAAVRLVIQVLDGLEAIHAAEIVHRDIKPGNLILGEQGLVKIADFGLARDLMALEGLSSLGKALGTPYYMSPEQAAGNLMGLGTTSDLFSVGVLLYELLAGRRPFDGDSFQTIFRAVLTATPVPARRLNPRVDRYLWNILQRALEKNPDQRYQTAADFAQDLERYLRKEPVVFGRPSWRDRWRRRMYTQSPLARVGAYMAIPATTLFSLVVLFRPSSNPVWVGVLLVVVVLSMLIGPVLLLASFFHRGRPKFFPSAALVLVGVGWTVAVVRSGPSEDPETRRLYENGELSAVVARVTNTDFARRPVEDQKRLVQALQKLNQFSRALAATEEMGELARYSKSVELWFRVNRASCLIQLGRSKEALELIRARAGGDSDLHTAARRVESAALIALHRYDEALSLARDAGDSTRVKTVEAILSSGLDSPVRTPAIDAILEAEDPWSGVMRAPGGWKGLPRLLQKLEHRCGDPVAQCPAGYLSLIASRLYGLGDHERAKRYAEAALSRLDVDDAALQYRTDALATLARLYDDQGDADAALAHAKAAFRLAWQELDFMATGALLHRLLQSRGEHDAAARVAELTSDSRAFYGVFLKDLRRAFDDR